jgi:hypothetical protein
MQSLEKLQRQNMMTLRARAIVMRQERELCATYLDQIRNGFSTVLDYFNDTDDEGKRTAVYAGFVAYCAGRKVCLPETTTIVS